ncbi:MAG: hypothetical protein J07HB67_02422 [halophilic archaeon J07HB67]|nr:MAG: hypothetical protein J07HB67_02422 [halophilic archaeon J07HB67]
MGTNTDTGESKPEPDPELVAFRRDLHPTPGAGVV